MEFYRNLSIRGKIFTLIVLVVIFELILSAVGIFFLFQMNNNLKEIVTVQAENIRIGARSNRNLVEIQRDEKNMLLSKDREELSVYADNISETQVELEQRLVEMKSLADESKKELINQFEVDYQQYKQINDQVQALLLESVQVGIEERSRAVEEATRLSQGDGRQAYEQAIKTMELIVNTNDEDLDFKVEQSNRNANLALFIMISLSLVSIALGLFAGYKISGAIVANLSDLVTVADAIAAGDLDSPVSIESNDEVGRLASSVSQMQTSLYNARRVS